MTILITGVQGFLGVALAKALTESKRKVVGIDISPSTQSYAWPTFVGDVGDRSFIEKLFANHKIESIIHCGGISGPHVCNNDPAKVFEVNVDGTLNLLEIATEKGMPGRFVFISSSSVYGEPSIEKSKKTPLLEREPLLANEPYGCSKVCCESILRSYVHQKGLDGVSLRVSIVYGPKRTTYCGITKLLEAGISHEPLRVMQGADLPLPWIYITDVVEAIQAALNAPKESIKALDTLAYNVTGPGFPTFQEIAGVVQSLFPRAEIQQVNEPDPYAMNARRMSLESIKQDLGWEPKVSMKMGIEMLYKTMKK